MTWLAFALFTVGVGGCALMALGRSSGVVPRNARAVCVLVLLAAIGVAGMVLQVAS